jgi:hypothetical protein
MFCGIDEWMWSVELGEEHVKWLKFRTSRAAFFMPNDLYEQAILRPQSRLCRSILKLLKQRPGNHKLASRFTEMSQARKYTTGTVCLE